MKGLNKATRDCSSILTTPNHEFMKSTRKVQKVVQQEPRLKDRRKEMKEKKYERKDFRKEKKKKDFIESLAGNVENKD
ncbi:CLUMA_CG004405, isoform A [Clunio marinus]|uniref:CLUMA_CG004405, isoform A n=1 Tax=Clunio marinus TaxID=568069 RepID=A0A1J1HRK9_9DIPT|nr:CLUMA_CG004405, isoform A [Clunio marinus]